MPRYKVTSPGFHGGVLYSPEGKPMHRVLTVDKPFTEDKTGKDKKVVKGTMPSWVHPKPIPANVPAKAESGKSGVPAKPEPDADSDIDSDVETL